MGIGGWELSDEEFESYYGPWAERGVSDVAALFEGYPGLWWIAGGWAIEAFSGVSRPHEDVDPSVLLGDLDTLRDHLRGKYQMWSASSGALRPVFASLPAGDERLLLEHSGQVWLRRGPDQPWEFDVLLTPGSDQEWVCKRDRSITLPMTQALWQKDGVRYLRPEPQLLLKAAHRRPKDDADLAACLPLFDADGRDWLRASLAQVHPGHPWLDQLA